MSTLLVGGVWGVVGAVIKAARLESQRLTLKFQRKRMFLSRSLVKIQYCGKPPRPRGSVLEFQILCLTVSSYSSHHPQDVLLAQFSLYVHKGGIKKRLFRFILLLQPFSLKSVTARSKSECCC